ncbi:MULTISPECIES: ABC transporter permease [unclassified Mycoplasma]|uniref:iron chelate uptake ABC transporter family permease subunit n=1 Tax=unclassified Mycoplasma TaxID=2683645 RepID=UPI000FDD9CD4
MVSVIVIGALVSIIIIFALAAVGGMVSEKAGVINLSIEGFMTIGAISYAVFANLPSVKNILAYQWLLFPLAGLFGSVFAIIYALATVKLKANQTIAGIALNALAVAISFFIIKLKKTSEIEMQPYLWTLGENNQSFVWIFNIAVFLGLPMIGLVIVVLNYTKFGKLIKAVGENPDAAATLGVRVEWIQIKAVVFSAFFSALAGAIYAQNISGYFHGTTQGAGFLAVALVIFGQWKPSLILLGSIIFGSIYAIINNATLIPVLNTIEGTDLLHTIPYLLSTLVLIFSSRHSRAPRSLGIPYSIQGR